ncbi:MAG: S-methyl-5-thioribose-1-phosphate isomerase, partial [Dehalococcoidia bacterium]
MIRPIEWLDDRIRIIDQTRLPGDTVYLDFTGYQDVVEAIKELKVRGAPAIGIAAAYGIALGALNIKQHEKKEFLHQLEAVMQDFAVARPTAV